MWPRSILPLRSQDVRRDLVCAEKLLQKFISNLWLFDLNAGSDGAPKPHLARQGTLGIDYGLGKSTGSDGSAVNIHRAL
jgi:hypothetical protein